MNSTLYYVYDALCGWCYGFSPVMKKLHDNYHTQLKFAVVSGGMVLGERAGPIGKVAPYIKDAYKRVEEMTGVIFGEPFLAALDEGSMIFSSDMPSRALTHFRELHPEKQVEFAHALQSAIYSRGLAPTAKETYTTLAAEFGIANAAGFADALATESITQKTTEDYQLSQRFQATGFPTVIVHHGDTYYLIARGYTDYASLEERLKQILSKNEEA
jgi:putative protein-disulfide isomerase